VTLEVSVCRGFVCSLDLVGQAEYYLIRVAHGSSADEGQDYGYHRDERLLKA